MISISRICSSSAKRYALLPYLLLCPLWERLPRQIAAIVLKARSDQSKARYDYIRDLTNLRARAGTLSAQDIGEIDGWMQRSASIREGNEWTSIDTKPD